MYAFEYCQKIVVFRNDDTEVLLCKRKWEADYDGVFSFIWGKMETGDVDVLTWIVREVREEIGWDVSLAILPYTYFPLSYVKKNGNAMLLPHYYASYLWWSIILSDEYSTYEWVPVATIDTFEPKIATIPSAVRDLLALRARFSSTDLVHL